MVLVKDAMTKNVCYLSPESSIYELLQLMSKKEIGSVVIVDKNHIPLQIFTLRDIPKIFSLSFNRNQIQEIILKLNKQNKNLITIRQNQSIMTALNFMNKNEVSHLPVVNNERKLVGILSMRDLLKHFPSIIFTDSLTQINNRMYLDIIRPKIETTKSMLGILMIDIDNFKNINDNYGHSFGDTVLREIAKLLRSSVKSYDEVIRYGGEEFLVILYRCDENAIKFISERLRKGIKKIKFPSHESLQVTVSIGCCIFRPNNKLADIIEKADKALYKAKREGKDKVVYAN